MESSVSRPTVERHYANTRYRPLFVFHQTVKRATSLQCRSADGWSVVEGIINTSPLALKGSLSCQTFLRHFQLGNCACAAS